MQTTGATEVRKQWSSICDSVTRVRPEMIRRKHDIMFLSSKDNILLMLNHIKYDVSIYNEDDGSVTAASNDMDLVENAENKETAIQALALSIIDYAQEFFENYQHYSNAPNRKSHIPFITKAFLLDNEHKVQEEMICRIRKS